MAEQPVSSIILEPTNITQYCQLISEWTEIATIALIAKYNPAHPTQLPAIIAAKPDMIAMEYTPQDFSNAWEGFCAILDQHNSTD